MTDRPRMDPWRQLAARFRHGDITPIELRRVARAVDALPDDLHHIFCQCRFEGLSFAEIGEGLDISAEEARRKVAGIIALISHDTERQARAEARWRRLLSFWRWP
ncbi:sigma factor-like helix-turn-helix DNA-binding protein [Sphingobium yanoikuyae]|uniref:RNA polymerase sigma-70 region 4 domain-containing protein n=2 Tax=Sphingobium yanoikuyae TaxID=13690 RepID=A0A3G2UYZ2_SPHYA|nr:sigma factor-like helix-turn-helix DNA-binding protein [Sphingobium yanoikuyae]AYO79252.1 hypothetical protein EBF16_21620 [Sphingobium yanoikuyae]